MGKTTVAGLLLEGGMPVVDSDELAREVVAPGTVAMDEIRRTFGAGFMAADGSLDRAKMAGKVFADATARQALEAIIHPRVRALWMAQAARWRAQQVPHAAVVIPLLYEVKAEGEMDQVLCVACTPATQRQRLRARGWSDAQIEQRIHAQWPVEQKMARADRVIWTEGSIDVVRSQLFRLWPGQGKGVAPSVR